MMIDDCEFNNNDVDILLYDMYVLSLLFTMKLRL